jgi:hypothetical protein
MTTEIRERPILFNSAMVRAILGRRKTQTRRVVKTKTSQCPYGKPGDWLWVRERFAAPHDCDHLKPSEIPAVARIHYPATEDTGGLLVRPSIFMPRWASRINLQITHVRKETLSTIIAADAMAEGCPEGCPSIGWFFELWKAIHGPESMLHDPLVWVVEFLPEGELAK